MSPELGLFKTQSAYRAENSRFFSNLYRSHNPQCAERIDSLCLTLTDIFHINTLKPRYKKLAQPQNL